MKIKRLSGIRIEVEPPCGIADYCRDLETVAKRYEAWAAEFQAFVRDHRSQDPIRLSVIRDTETVCSHCGYEWEEDKDGPLCCQKAQDEHNAAQAMA